MSRRRHIQILNGRNELKHLPGGQRCRCGDGIGGVWTTAGSVARAEGVRSLVGPVTSAEPLQITVRYQRRHKWIEVFLNERK
jgi:hypothetical protein